MCGPIAMCNRTKSCNKITYFCPKIKLNQKGNVRNFLLYLVIFLTKFEQHNTAFQSSFSEIIRIWELLFRLVGSYFFFTFIPARENRFSTQQKLVYFNYPYILPVYMVGKAGYSLTYGDKRISNRNLVMLRIFRQSDK